MSQVTPSYACLLRLSAVADLCSGFSLAGSTSGTIGIAILAIFVLAVTVAIIYFAARKTNRSALPLGSSEPSSVQLNDFNASHEEAISYRPFHSEGQPVNGRGFL